MGFRTVAISKRVSEVWNVLGAAKAEFNNYADAWKRLERHLNTAQNTVQELGRRTRAVERKLHNVEAMERPNGHTDSPALQSAFEDGEEAEQYEMGSTMAAGVAPQPAPRG
jgi:DNA recombination protein RmuC